MELNRFEKIIVTRNLRHGMERIALGIFDQRHLQALHAQLCQNLDHRPELAAGKPEIPATTLDQFAQSVSETANAVIGENNKSKLADDLASTYVNTLTVSPFASFNKQVAMLVIDGMAKSSGNVIDWSKMKSEALDQCMVGSNPRSHVAELIESAITPVEKMELSPLERKEVYISRQPMSFGAHPKQAYLVG